MQTQVVVTYVYTCVVYIQGYVHMWEFENVYMFSTFFCVHTRRYLKYFCAFELVEG